MNDESTTRVSRYFGAVTALMDRMEVTGVRGAPLDAEAGTETVTRELERLRDESRKVLLVGNGGSATIAGHMEMDLCNRARIRAIVFNDPPVLTALANDFGYVHAFERLVGLWADPGDCLVAISSSGASKRTWRKPLPRQREKSWTVSSTAIFLW